MNRLLLTAYRAALRLYPEPFRQRYTCEMSLLFENLLSECHAVSEGHSPLRRPALRSPFALSARILQDLILSLFKEHLAVFTRNPISRLVTLQALLLMALSTILALMCYGAVQQTLRTGANEAPLQLATDAAALMIRGTDPAAVLPPLHIDPSTSNSPFVIVYDDEAHPLASSATLNDSTPVPPRGVLDLARRYGEHRVTWMPKGRGEPRSDGHVRIAAVIRHFDGPHPGFVLAGRSLVETESIISNIGHFIAVAWFGAMFSILAGTFLIGCLTSPPQAPSTA